MVAIICEFNPFHNGHQYIIETAKRLTNEPVLAVMSGSFCQRGEVAVCSKFERAAAALRYGADIVAELPAVHAVSCAQRFAQAGVHIAKAFESTGCLAFGCEDDDLTALQTAADAFQNEAVNRKIAFLMKSGAYYPQAAEQAVREVCGDAAADMLTQPNTVLAVEYLRALRGSSVKPLPIRRVGAAHHSRESCGSFLSASAIRERLRRGEDVSAFMPEPPSEITFPPLLERAVLYRLRTMTAAQLRALPEVGEGLENRLAAAVKTSRSVEEIIARFTGRCRAAKDLPAAGRHLGCQGDENGQPDSRISAPRHSCNGYCRAGVSGCQALRHRLSHQAYPLLFACGAGGQIDFLR